MGKYKSCSKPPTSEMLGHSFPSLPKLPCPALKCSGPPSVAVGEFPARWRPVKFSWNVFPLVIANGLLLTRWPLTFHDVSYGRYGDFPSFFSTFTRWYFMKKKTYCTLKYANGVPWETGLKLPQLGSYSTSLTKSSYTLWWFHPL